MEEQSEKSRIKKLYDKVEDYARSTFELYKLKGIKSFAEIFASVSTGIILGLVSLMVLVFASIGLALWLGAIMNGWHYGFFTVAGIYAIVLAIIYMNREKYFKESITDYILKQIFKD